MLDVKERFATHLFLTVCASVAWIMIVMAIVIGGDSFVVKFAHNKLLNKLFKT